MFESPSLEAFKAGVDVAFRDIGSVVNSSVRLTVGLSNLRGLFQPNASVIPTSVLLCKFISLF